MKPGGRQRRSARTRQKIKEALIRLLDEHNYFDLTIGDICRRAKIATGGFYFHYEKKADLIDEVLREHSAGFWAALEAFLDYRDPYSAVYHTSSALVRAFHESPGLVRCFNQLAMVDRAYVQLWESAASRWAAKLAQTLEHSVPAATAADLESTASGMLSFLDQLLFGLYVEKYPGLIEAAGAFDEVVENLAVLWYRALSGQSPPPERLAYASRGAGI